MRQSPSSLLALAAFGAIACSAGEAKAQSFFEEARFAVLDHDTDLVGNAKEGGFDVGVEVLSQPLDALAIVLRPRLAIGAVINSEDYTNQVYVGLVQQWNFARDVVTEGDALFLEGAAGIAYLDGKDDVRGTPEESEWKSHGTPWAIRTGWGLGYRFRSGASLQFSFHHVSNADLAEPNEGSNDVGLRLGLRF